MLTTRTRIALPCSTTYTHAHIILCLQVERWAYWHPEPAVVD